MRFSELFSKKDFLERPSVFYEEILEKVGFKSTEECMQGTSFRVGWIYEGIRIRVFPSVEGVNVQHEFKINQFDLYTFETLEDFETGLIVLKTMNI